MRGSVLGGRPGRRLAPVLLAAMLAACTAPAGAVPSEGTSRPGSSLPTSTPAASSDPGSSVVPSRAAPAAVVERPWAVDVDGGILIGATADATAVAVESPQEHVVVIAPMGVVTTTPTDKGSVIRVRNVDGAVAAEFESDVDLRSGAVVGGRVVLSGFAAGEQTTDPGIWVLARGELTLVVAPAPPPKGISSDITRAVKAGPTGTVASALCGRAGGCEIQTVDLDAGTITPVTSNSGFLGNVGDGVAVVGDQEALAVVDLATGKVLWELTGDEYSFGYVTSDGTRLVQSYVDHLEGTLDLVVAVFDLRSGARRIVWRAALDLPLTLWPNASTDTHAVIGDDLMASALAKGDAPAAVLDLETGDLARDALRFDAP